MTKLIERIYENKRLLCLSIFLAGFIVRVAYIFYAGVKLEADSPIFDTIARNIMAGRGIVFDGPLFTLYAHRPPGYPLFIAFIYSISEDSVINIAICQSALGALLNVLILKFAEKIFDQRTALIAALIGTFYPYFIYISGFIYPTLIFSLFVMAFLFYLYRSTDAGSSPVFPIASGLSYGYASLAYSASITLLPFMLLWYILFSKLPRRKLIQNILLVLISSSLLIVPWGLRNYRLLDKFLLTSSIGGINFLRGTFDGYEITEKSKLIEEKWAKSRNELEVDNLYYEEAKERIAKAPFEYFKLCLYKPFEFWSPLMQERPGYAVSKSPAVKAVALLSYGPILILGIAGLIKARAKKKELILVLLVFLYFTAIYTAYFPVARFRIPLDPLLIIFAAYTVTSSKIFSRFFD